jgi:L-asparaginase
MNILCIQTGGTIDKNYPQHGVAYNFEIADPAVNRILELINPSFTYRALELLKKDSTDITDEDRQLIHEACVNAEEKYIIITHGTDTMVDTARALSDIENKVIVITGSMRPERFVNSDAAFNIGTAVGALGIAKDGVYVAMSGRVLLWDKVTKDYAQSKFVEN